MALPLNTIERLENAVDLVFERVIFFNVIRKKYEYIFDLDINGLSNSYKLSIFLVKALPLT